MFSWSTPGKSRGRFTLVEAAVLANEEAKSARHALNDVLGRSASGLSARDVLFLVLRRSTLSVASGGAIQAALYRSLHEPALRMASRHEVSVKLNEGPHPMRLLIDSRDAVRRVLSRIRCFREGSRRVERRDDVIGGALVFKGTRIPVEHVGALLKRGMTAAVIKEEFSTLTDIDLEFAQILVELNPPRGRPRKRLELRRNHSAKDHGPL